MTPEDWKTYWRTCHLTPFQIQDMERWEIEAHKAEARSVAMAPRVLSEAEKWQFREMFEGELIEIASWSREGGHVDRVQECLDSMELQMMGIRG